MAAGDSLFNLVKSLNKAHKRYFKLYCGEMEGKKNNYMLLFEAIEKQKTYDEEKIKLKFSNNKFAKHLASEKSYLYELILRAMRDYYSEKSIDAKIRGLLNDIEFLFENRLIKQCQKRMAKVLKLAVKYEKYKTQLELIEWDFKIQPLIVDKGITTKQDETSKERIGLLSKYDQLCRIDFYAIKIRQTLYLNPDYSNEKIVAESTRSFEELEASGLNMSMTWLMKSRYLVATIYHFMNLKDYAQAKIRNKDLIAHYEATPHFIEVRLKHYKGAITNYLSLCSRLKQFEEIPGIIKKYKQLPTYSESDQVFDFRHVYFAEMRYYLSNCKWEEMKAFVPVLEDKLNSIKAITEKSKQNFRSNILAFWFVLHDWDESRRWTDMIIESKTDARMDVRRLARWTEVMIHMESSEDEICSYILQSCYRYISAQNILTEFDIKLHKFFTKLLKLPKTDRKAYMTKQLPKFESFLKDKQHSGKDEFLTWLESKVTGVPMHQILSNKMKVIA